jgi:hypothetical protein
MTQALQDLIQELDRAGPPGSRELLQAYESGVAQRVSQLGSALVDTEPTPEAVLGWLRLYSRISGFALEGPANVTLTLFEQRRALFVEAERLLNPEEASAIEEFIAELQEPGPTDEDFPDVDLPDLLPGGHDLAARPPVLARFLIPTPYDGTRRVWKGRLHVSDRGGKEVLSIEARTGGFVPSYKSKNGPTPPGTYLVSHFRPDRSGTPGMGLHGVSFSFDLSNPPNAPGRSALRIHPDEAPDGTHGCVGVFAHTGEELRNFANTVNGILQKGPFRLSVTYGDAGAVV